MLDDQLLQVAGTGAVWAMLLAGIVCVATAFVYAELSSAWPVPGGEYVAVAHTLGPMAGFVMLGVNVFNNLFFPPVAGLGISAVLSRSSRSASTPGSPASSRDVRPVTFGPVTFGGAAPISSR